MQCMLTLILLLSVAQPALAASKAKALQEATEYLFRRGATKAGGETAEQLSKRAAVLVSRYGDEGLEAFRKLGTRSLRLADEAGEYGADAVRLMARHGEAATPLLRSPGLLSLCARHGDDAATALLRHGDVVAPVVRRFGTDGAKTAGRLTSRNARRLAMLTAENSIDPRVVTVVSQWGDEAMAFVWKNKASLAVSAGLVAFVADPERFLNGSARLTDVVAQHTLHPLTAVPIAAAKSIPWALSAGALLAAISFLIWRRHSVLVARIIMFATQLKRRISR